jgi:hypothetical protein
MPLAACTEPPQGLEDPDAQFAVRLRGLRHPLLTGDYLRRKAELEKLLGKVGGACGVCRHGRAAVWTHGLWACM